MPTPVTGTELKMRGHEVPRVTVLNSDHSVVVDGQTSGVATVTPATLHQEGVKQLPAKQSTGSEIINPTLSMLYGPSGNRQAAQFQLSEVLAGGTSMYLGPKSDPPTADNFGQPLRPGHLYFNLNDEVFYIWSSSGKWVISAASLPSAIRVYYYTFSIPGTLLPPNGPGTVDGLGNVLMFDTSSGQAAVSGVSVFINGVLLMNGVDYVVQEGGATGDTITLAEEMCAGSVAVVQVFASGTTQSFANSTQINTTDWVYDGRTTFPLVDMNGTPLVPNSANNCMISQGNRIIQPNVDFTVNNDQITFAMFPHADDNVWGVIGLPTTGVEGEFGSRVTVFQHGGIGNGVTDDSDAVEAAINQVNISKATLDLSGGTWRITRQMPTLYYPRVDGGGSGEIYVDYDMAFGTVLRCQPALGENYEVSAIAVVDYDFEGAFSALSKVTRLTLTLDAGQPMPQRGQIGKVTSSNPLIGVETGDTAGQMLAIVATDDVNHYVYMTGRLYDTYTTAVELQILGTEQVFLRNFGIRANWDRLVAENWYGTFILIIGAVFPKVADIWLRDGAQGLILAGTWMAGTRGIRVNRMRNATASTTAHVPGYGVVDAGSHMSVHTDLSGSDCRHVYTTISPDATATSPTATMLGVNLAGGEFSYPNSSQVKATVPATFNTDYSYPLTSWGYWAGKNIKLIRLPFRLENLERTVGALDATEVTRITAALDAAAAAGVKVLLDMHNYCRRYAPGTNVTPEIIGASGASYTGAMLATVWGLIANQWKSHSAIEYWGIMNEPHDLPTTSHWATIAQLVINSINAVDTSHSIVVSRDQWSSAHTWSGATATSLLSLTTSGAPLIFEAHCYFDDNHGGDYGQPIANEFPPSGVINLNRGVERATVFVNWCQANGKVGMITESGAPSGANDPTSDWAEIIRRTSNYLWNSGFREYVWAAGERWSATYQLDIQPSGTAPNYVDDPGLAVYEREAPEDSVGWPRVAWGRTILPQINGGQASSCSAAAYDTHSDCIAALFTDLVVQGSYYGQNSAGAGIQFRGAQCKATGCSVYDTQVGFEIYKQFAGEYGWHAIEGCTYLGAGVAINIDHDPALSAANAAQTFNLGDFYCETTNALIVNSWDAVVALVGGVRIIQKGDFSTGTAPRAWELRRNSGIASRGGTLQYDVALVTGSLLPRVFSLKDGGQNTYGATNIIVNAGGVAWQAVVSENEATPVVPGILAFNVDVDKEPNAASGGYSQNGAGNLLPAGSLKLIMTLNGGRVQPNKNAGFTVSAAMNRQPLVCIGTFTVTVPAANILGPDFWTDLLVVSGTVTIDGPGGTNPTVAAGNKARIQVIGNSIYQSTQSMGLIT